MKNSNNRTFEEIATLGTKRSAATENYEKLVESDFDNLDKLYLKCPALQLRNRKKINNFIVGSPNIGLHSQYWRDMASFCYA